MAPRKTLALTAALFHAACNSFGAVPAPAADADVPDTAEGVPDAATESALLGFDGRPLAGVVGHWRFDESTGDRVIDSSSSALHGTLVGGPARIDGRSGGGALSFDGVDDHIALPSTTKLDFDTRSFSYGLWIYVPAVPSGVALAWYKGGDTAASPGFDLEVYADATAAYVSDGVLIRGVAFGPLEVGKWIGLTVVVDRGAKRLRAYRDGAFVDEEDLTGMGSLISTQAALIARSSDVNTFFRGSLDDVFVVDRALGPEEVAALRVATP
jgi:sialidase-1